MQRLWKSIAPHCAHSRNSARKVTRTVAASPEALVHTAELSPLFRNSSFSCQQQQKRSYRKRVRGAARPKRRPDDPSMPPELWVQHLDQQHDQDDQPVTWEAQSAATCNREGRTIQARKACTKLNIAVEGCCHGELSEIYASVARMEEVKYNSTAQKWAQHSSRCTPN